MKRPRALLLSLSAATVLTFANAAPAPAASLAALLPSSPAGALSVPRGPRIYKLPYPAGMSFKMCQGNGESTHTGHGEYAWDFCMPIGSPVVASRGGTVRFVQQSFDGSGWGPAWADKNNYVVVDHGDGTSAIYMHLMHNGARVAVGQQVQTGQLLAYSGNTGWTHGPHTHFMVMQSSADDWYAQSLPVAFQDVASNGGVPVDGRRYTSGNAPLDPHLLLPRCNTAADSKAFAPFWVESFRTSSAWSGPDDKAVRFGPITPWQYFQVLAPQIGSKLEVRVAGTGGTAFIPAADVGPSGPPPQMALTCLPFGGRDRSG